MELHIATDLERGAATAARRISELLRSALAERGTATLALSGGSAPLPMFEALASEKLDWANVCVFQVDERVVDRGDPARNGEAIERLLIDPTGARAELFETRRGMSLAELGTEAHRIDLALADRCGSPPVIDVVHLGLGSDGHTASWPPGGAVLDELDPRIAPVEAFNGFDRLTMTVPIVNAARSVVWFIAGENKRDTLVRLMNRDQDIPAGWVSTRHQIIVSTVDRRGEPRG